MYFAGGLPGSVFLLVPLAQYFEQRDDEAEDAQSRQEALHHSRNALVLALDLQKFVYPMVVLRRVFIQGFLYRVFYAWF